MISINSKNWMLNEIEAIIFDKDGTLIDSHLYWGEIIKRRSNAIIECYNLNPNLFEKICLSMGFDTSTYKLLPNGPVALVGRDKVIQAVIECLKNINKSVSSTEIGELFVKVHTEFCDQLFDYIKILPGVLSFLESLHSLKIKMAIVTSDTVSNTNEILNYLKISKYFSCIVGKESCSEPKETGIPAKLALEELAIPSQFVVTIGDAPVDLQMAHVNSMKAGIGTASGQIPFENLLKVSQYIVYSMEELQVKGYL